MTAMDTSGPGLTGPEAAGPDAVTIEPLDPADGTALRGFCLEVIAEVFGYGYRPDWHDDLDRLVDPVHDYHPSRRGWFSVARRDGEIVGCAGLRGLEAKPDLARSLTDRYPRPDLVGSVWRVYVDPAERSNGIGRVLSDALDAEAAALGYSSLYLHTSAGSPRSVAFWQRQGYRPFRHDRDHPDSTLHMDKPVVAVGDGMLDLRPVLPTAPADGRR